MNYKSLYGLPLMPSIFQIKKWWSKNDWHKKSNDNTIYFIHIAHSVLLTYLLAAYLSIMYLVFKEQGSKSLCFITFFADILAQSYQYTLTLWSFCTICQAIDTQPKLFAHSLRPVFLHGEMSCQGGDQCQKNEQLVVCPKIGGWVSPTTPASVVHEPLFTYLVYIKLLLLSYSFNFHTFIRVIVQTSRSQSEAYN